MIIKRYVIKKSMTNTKQPDVYTQMKITKMTFSTSRPMLFKNEALQIYTCADVLITLSKVIIKYKYMLMCKA